LESAAHRTYDDKIDFLGERERGLEMLRELGTLGTESQVGERGVVQTIVLGDIC